MENIEKYLKIKHYFEDRFNIVNESAYGKIINRLCIENPRWNEFVTNSYNDDNESIFNLIHNQALDEEKDIPFLYQTIEHYQYNYFLTILWCIYDICNTKYKATEKYLIEKYRKAPYIYNIETNEDAFTIDCILGKIPFEKASNYFYKLNEVKLSKLAEDGILSEYCHDSTFKVCKTLKDSFAHTMLCKQSCHNAQQ